MINTNSVIKSICAVVMLLGMSVSAWGTDDVSTITSSSFDGLSKYWSADNNASNYDATRGAQWTTNAGTTFTATNFTNVSSISIQCAKSSTGTGTITITAGSKSKSINSFSSTNTPETLDLSSSPYTGTITIEVNATNKSLYMKSITVTYTPVPYTVTFEKEGGEFDDPSVFINTNQITEASGGAGITLPLVNPSASMASMGWGFYGWAEDAVGTPTTTAPTIVGKAGDTYYPSSATTLHAVFAKGEFTKITSESQITSGGKYLIAGWFDSKVHVMTSTYIHTDDYYMKEKVVSEYTSGKIRAIDIDGTWRYTITGSSNAYFIQDVVHNSNNYIDTYYTNWYNCSYSSSHSYKIVFDGGTCYIKNNQGSYPYLVLFAKGDFGTVGSVWAGMLLYKETTECMFASNPKTVKVVASPVEGGDVDFYLTGTTEEVFTDEYVDLAEAAANDGYEFLRWETSNATNAKFSDGSAYTLTTSTDDDPEFKATGDATLTAYFYKQSAVGYTLTGLTKTSGPDLITASVDAADIVWVFSVNDHYRTTPLTCSVTMGGSPLTSGTDYTWNESTKTLTIPAATDITGDLVITISAEHTEYTKYAFSCAELTLTPVLATASTPIFITSTASKTVRSQDYIEITGNGLTPNTALSFGELGKFAIKNADGTAVTTDVNGAISTNAYIFYTPDAGDTSDGLDKLTGITVSVGGAKPKTVVLTQDIIGRHLPADFVIAGKKDNKWYALPADFSDEKTPDPVEIAVDDINNPTIAYTANTNIYNLYGQNTGNSGFLYNDGDSDGNPDGEKIKLGMKNNSNKPLFAYAFPKNSLKGDGSATVTNNINKQYWWTLKQINTSITNPQDAKYNLISSNNPGTLSIKNSPFAWGTYATGVEELRLIPASSITFTEAYFVEWGQHGGVIEVDAQGIDATSVTAHLGVNSATTTLSQTLTSGKSRASKYNYTVNFDGIDFAAAASNGALLTLEWKNGETVKAMSNIVVPKIVASNITINKENYPLKSDWNTEVHVLPGKTVTIDADYSPNPDVTIKELNIYPGATVVASTGTLIATNLVLRNGWSRAGSKTYDVARLHVTAPTATLKASNVYADWYIDYDQYYPIAVPWDVTLSGITYRYCSVEPSVGPSENIRLKYYDGESRATNVQEGVGSGANWKTYGATGCTDVPGTLEPSKGYAMTAKRPTGKAFSIIRMPLTIPSADWISGGEKGEVGGTHKDQVSVTAWGTGSTPTYAKGWNLIANPYMANYQGTITYTEGTELVNYVNIPDVDFKEYDQKPTAVTKLAPASAFLIKAPATGTITFGTANRKPSAPSYRTEEKPESIPEQQAYIVLSNEQSEDMMGILVSEKYTSEYETNADLEKLLSDGNTLRTYMHYGDMNMAYVAINEMLAKEWIPVSVRIPADGEYTFSLHEASIAGELEGVYLIDYQNGDKVTNLIEQSYTFSSTAGTINGRFSINAKTGERQTPTGIDAINAGGDINSDKPFKFIYHDKVYIWINGVIYDTTGKRVK